MTLFFGSRVKNQSASKSNFQRYFYHSNDFDSMSNKFWIFMKSVICNFLFKKYYFCVQKDNRPFVILWLQYLAENIF